MKGRRLKLGNVSEIEDKILFQMGTGRVRSKQGFATSRGGDERRLLCYMTAEVARAGKKPSEKSPYELEIVKPRAIDLKKLWKKTGQAVPAEIESSLGASVPVLISHGMTPFALPGKSPDGVWGMGYEVKINKPDEAATVSLMPSCEKLKIASVGQTMQVKLGLGGEMKVPEQVLPVANAIPGLKLNGASISAATDQEFSLSIQANFALVKIMAAPVGSGGARWDLYRQAEPLEHFHPLLQTVLLPKGTKKLNVTISTWIKRGGWLGSDFLATQWTSRPVSYDISLDGLKSPGRH